MDSIFEEIFIFIKDFIDNDFLKTLIATVFGGLISLSSVLLVENSKNKKETKKRKREIYYSLITTLNSLKNLEKHFSIHAIGFSYQRQLLDITTNPELKNIAIEQTKHHQNNIDKYIEKISIKSEILQALHLEYNVLTNGNSIDKHLSKIYNWNRPSSPNYNHIDNLEILSQKCNNDKSKYRKHILNTWNESVNNIEKMISKTLL